MNAAGTILDVSIPLILIGMYTYLCFSEILKPFYQKVSFIFIQVYYICIILSWFISSYMPLLRNFPDQNSVLKEDQQHLLDIYYLFLDLVNNLIPEVCVNYLMFRYYLIQSYSSDPSRQFKKFFAIFGIYIIGTMFFNGSCWFGYGSSICKQSWFQYVTILFDSLPIILSLIFLILTMRSLSKRSDGEDIFDASAVIGRQQVRKIGVILAIRIMAITLMLGWNIVHTFVAKEEDVYKFIDQVLEIIYKTLCGSVFLIKVNW
ncbi:Hypothetical_protein [Hexamita inflata]|uniref:Hypothetical_protein n=1 Tax=Hexamita inflata TaxID=28002 RepID=A0ABP1H3V7_9EUKA